MPKAQDLNKVLVIGSGPIIIGQAAEFDYAGTQACHSLKEEGLEVVLVNSNPATIMTDPGVADRVYLEPLTFEFVAEVLRRERPEGLLPTLGGQVGLNLAVALSKGGILAETGTRLLGTPLAAIEKAEDRRLFRELMLELGEPIPGSRIVERVEDGLDFAATIGFPLIVRPAYTLGGTGGGIAWDDQHLRKTLERGLTLSPIGQVLLEQSILGWKEIEYEVLRDGADNVITVCNMENLDPVGVHTGDSIVVAPSQTLTDREYHLLRGASLRIIRALGVEGGCNVQFGFQPETGEYRVIEVNPRVSRSSALASKATGYPIAKVAAKIAVGLHLAEIENPVTGQTKAAFEPALDYCVVKIPRWPFDKFSAADRELTTQMKATGEVMAIDRTFEGALQKAVRSTETGAGSLDLPGIASLSTEDLVARLAPGDDRRLFYLVELLRRGKTPDELANRTGIDVFFLHKMANIVAMEVRLRGGLPATTLREAKRLGFSDRSIAAASGSTEEEVRKLRLRHGIVPTYKMVDTCAAEFEATTPYYYATYEEEDEAPPLEGRKVVVLGSGPIRIGQGIEFDCCSVHALGALRARGVKSIIINCNPETVSTDYSASDRLYFEPLQEEDVRHILERENPLGVMVQFGGQTAINLAAAVAGWGYPILGTDLAGIAAAEDREKFDRLLEELDIPRPRGRIARSSAEAERIGEELGYPVLVRPSYVLGGRAMEIVYGPGELGEYLATAVQVSPRQPVLVDKYHLGREIEVDAICDGETVLIPGIMEHVERAGVHSGDSIAVYPPQRLSRAARETVVEYTVRLGKALRTKGLLNIQYVVQGDRVLVLEANPRSSRTVPYLSKVTGIPMVKLATRVMLGERLRDLGYAGGLYPEPEHVAVKVPVFSWAKLAMVDAYLGPEMKSTGEVMGINRHYGRALYKALVAAGYQVRTAGAILATIADRDKEEAVPLLAELSRLGYRVYATAGTAAALEREGVAARRTRKIEEGEPNLLNLIDDREVDLVVNTLTKGRGPERDGFRIRRVAVEHGIPCLTSVDTLWAFIWGLRTRLEGEDHSVKSLNEYLEEADRDRRGRTVDRRAGLSRA